VGVEGAEETMDSTSPTRLGLTLTGFGLYRVGRKSPVEKWA